MSHLWKKVQDEMVDEKTKQKIINIILVPSQRIQDSKHFYKILKKSSLNNKESVWSLPKKPLGRFT